MDAFTHLDMSAPDPIADLQSRMSASGVQRALVVETWSGDNRSCLDRIVNCSMPEFRVAFCYRTEMDEQFEEVIAEDRLAAWRVRTSDLPRLEKIGEAIQSSDKWLMVHAENGVGELAVQLLKIVRRFPALKMYVPHLAWPRRDGVDDPNWFDSVTALSRIPGLVLGVSAMAYFSREPFPHRDVERLASQAIKLFSFEHVAVASDYPLFEKNLYGDYMQLAEDWVRAVHPNWSPTLESDIFKDRKTT